MIHLRSITTGSGKPRVNKRTADKNTIKATAAGVLYKNDW